RCISTPGCRTSASRNTCSTPTRPTRCSRTTTCCATAACTWATRRGSASISTSSWRRSIRMRPNSCRSRAWKTARCGTGDASHPGARHSNASHSRGVQMTIDNTSRPGRAAGILAAGIAALMLAACGGEPSAQAASGSDEAAPPVHFDWFEYTGRDAAFEAEVPEGSFRNPVLSGFHSDPSVVAANGKFYLVASTFTFFPGIPVFESEDLVHWKQVGNAIHRPEQLDFDGLGVSRGVFAPATEFHDGTVYVVNPSVDAGGHFIVTATEPAGPWSDPIWLPTIGGIDPSLFFDDDGKVYILNTDEPEVAVRYDGHRAIWLQEIDIASGKPFGPRKVLIDGGVKPEENPIWIEGPHIYKVD